MMFQIKEKLLSTKMHLQVRNLLFHLKFYLSVGQVIYNLTHLFGIIKIRKKFSLTLLLILISIDHFIINYLLLLIPSDMHYHQHFVIVSSLTHKYMCEEHSCWVNSPFLMSDFNCLLMFMIFFFILIYLLILVCRFFVR